MKIQKTYIIWKDVIFTVYVYTHGRAQAQDKLNYISHKAFETEPTFWLVRSNLSSLAQTN